MCKRHTHAHMFHKNTYKNLLTTFNDFIASSGRILLGSIGPSVNRIVQYIALSMYTANAPIATAHSHANSTNASSEKKRRNVRHRVQKRKGRNRNEEHIIAQMTGWIEACDNG